MPDAYVYQGFTELIERLLDGDEGIADLAATDPEGLLAAYGVLEGYLDGMDFRQAVADTYRQFDLPEASHRALRSYVAGGPAPDDFPVPVPPPAAARQTQDHAVAHLRYVTYAVFEQHAGIRRAISR